MKKTIIEFVKANKGKLAIGAGVIGAVIAGVLASKAGTEETVPFEVNFEEVEAEPTEIVFEDEKEETEEDK